MINFNKTTPTCSNIYLIDENLCLSNTLNILNHNVTSLSEAMVEMTTYYPDWINLYSIFQNYSAKWIKTATNIQTFSAMWIDTATTVYSLSSRWNKPYTIYYPKMLDVNYWTGITKGAQQQLIITWLNSNFNPKNYNENQIIDVVVYLNQYQPFVFSFTRSFYEPCTPNGGSLTLTCGGCGRPYRGCNHHGGAAGYGPCTNAYAGCSVSSESVPVSVSCVGTGEKMLNIGISRTASDKNTARTDILRLMNKNKTWIAI